jgi:hypothetical protein
LRTAKIRLQTGAVIETLFFEPSANGSCVPQSRRSLSDLTLILLANAANGTTEPNPFILHATNEVM